MLLYAQKEEKTSSIAKGLLYGNVIKISPYPGASILAVILFALLFPKRLLSHPRQVRFRVWM